MKMKYEVSDRIHLLSASPLILALLVSCCCVTVLTQINLLLYSLGPTLILIHQ